MTTSAPRGKAQHCGLDDDNHGGDDGDGDFG
jgi:hypothetical protein